MALLQELESETFWGRWAEQTDGISETLAAQVY
jgi:hypothetical protein